MAVSKFKKDQGSYMSEQTYYTLWDSCWAPQTIIPRFLFNSFNFALKKLNPKHHPSYYISPPRIFHSMSGTKKSLKAEDSIQNWGKYGVKVGRH